jgi:hypothetical protein
LERDLRCFQPLDVLLKHMMHARPSLKRYVVAARLGPLSVSQRVVIENLSGADLHQRPRK